MEGEGCTTRTFFVKINYHICVRFYERELHRLAMLWFTHALFTKRLDNIYSSFPNKTLGGVGDATEWVALWVGMCYCRIRFCGLPYCIPFMRTWIRNKHIGNAIVRKKHFWASCVKVQNIKTTILVSNFPIKCKNGQSGCWFIDVGRPSGKSH